MEEKARLESGTFIVFEGPEGSGKTSIINELKKHWEENFKNSYPVFTREPGGVKIAENIRDIILNKENVEMDPLTEVLLYAAARQQHVKEVILPAITRGDVVICDRYVDSSIAYQGHARNVGTDKVKMINQPILDIASPTLVVYLDLLPEIGLQRIETANRETNRLDCENIEFHKAVREGYLKNLSENTLVIDASKDFDEVFKSVIRGLKLRIE